MRILWQEVFTETLPFTSDSGLVWQGVKSVVDEAKSASTCVDQKFLSRSSELNWYPYLEMLNNAEIIDSILLSEQAGYDAAVIGCYCDPGLHAARGVVDIPVVGLSEAAMTVAQRTGARFACVTVWENYIPIMEKNIRLYGWEQRAIALRPVRHFPLDWDLLISAFKGDAQKLIAQFEEIALSCIEDGADTIIAGCGYLGPALHLAGYRFVGSTQVPVIDCVSAGMVMAESMVALRRTTGLIPSRCPKSPFAVPPKKQLTKIRARFGFKEPSSQDKVVFL